MYLPLVDKKAPSNISGDNPEIETTIYPDGTVNGTVGSCTFRYCIAKKIAAGWDDG